MSISKNLFKYALIVFTACMLLFSLSATGTMEEDTTPRSAFRSGEYEYGRIAKISDYFGNQVVLPSGRNIGEVNDAVIDAGQGYLTHFIIRFTYSDLHPEEEEFALPLHLFEKTDRTDVLRLLTSSETYLRNLPPMEEVEDYRADPVEDWRTGLYSYQTIPPTGQSISSVNQRQRVRAYRYTYASGPRILPGAIIRVSDLFEQAVTSLQGAAIGSLSNITADIRSGQLYHAQFRAASSANTAFRNYLIPLNAFTLNTETFTISYDLESYGLPSEFGFNTQWPDITDSLLYRNTPRIWRDRNIGLTLGLGMRLLPSRLYEASQLTGYDVLNLDNYGLGTIVDLIIQPSGMIDYAVMEYDQTLGFGGKRTLLPISIMDVGPQTETVRIDVLLANLESAPSYPSDRIPNTGADNWDQGVRTYWSNFYRLESEDTSTLDIPTVENFSSMKGTHALPVSHLYSFTVYSEEGEVSGSIDEVYLDLSGRSIGFVTVSVNDTGGLLGNAKVPVPLSRLTLRPGTMEMELRTTMEEVQNAPGFNNLPSLPGTEFLESVRDYWM